MEENKRGRGRPREETTRNSLRGVRFDDEEEEMLRQLHDLKGMTTSDIIRASLRGYYAYERAVSTYEYEGRRE